MNSIYTLGYTGLKPDKIDKWLQLNNAVIADIRMSPRSRVPMWEKDALIKQLGERYVHIPALGNVNYKNGGVITLADPAMGLKLIEVMIDANNVVLMCACKHVATCHRSYAADFLMAKLGVSVIHLQLADIVSPGTKAPVGPASTVRQLRLF